MAVIVGQGISVSPVPDAKLSHESTGTVQNKAVADAIAAEYSTSKTYSVGDVCTHDGKLYECIVDIPTAEGWTSAHWKVSNLGDVASDLNRQLSDNFSNTATKEYTAQGAGWLKYSIKAGHTYRFENIGAARFTDIETTNSEGYSYIEQVSNGFNSGAVVDFVPTQDAKYIFAYAVGAAKYSVTDITTNKVLFDNINALNNVDQTTNENIMSLATAIAGESEYITLNPMWEVGGLTNSDGENWDNNFSIRSQYIYVDAATRLVANCLSTVNSAAIVFYNASKEYVSFSSITAEHSFDLIANTYFRVWVYGNIANPANVNTPTDYLTISIKNDLYSGIPEYYKTYMESKLTEIKDAASYVRGITFPFITDVHLQSNTMNAGALIKYIDHNTNAVPFVIFGGDVPKAIDTSANVLAYADKWNEYMSVWGKHKTVQVHGNHDYMCRVEGSETNWFAPLSTVFEYIQQNNYFHVLHPVNALYGAVDIENQKIKIIIADNYDAGYNMEADTWNGAALMSNEQLKWIAQTVLDSADYHVLFVTHVPTLVSMSVQSEATALKPFDDLIKAARNKTSYSIAGQTFDFTSWTGTVIAELAGHMHKDADGTSDNVLYIGTTCDCYNDSDPNVDRVVGTTTEQAFDVVNIDATNRKITLVRIGGGNNRSFDY